MHDWLHLDFSTWTCTYHSLGSGFHWKATYPDRGRRRLAQNGKEGRMDWNWRHPPHNLAFNNLSVSHKCSYSMVITQRRLNWPKELAFFASLIMPNEQKWFHYLNCLVVVTLGTPIGILPELKLFDQIVNLCRNWDNFGYSTLTSDYRVSSMCRFNFSLTVGCVKAEVKCIVLHCKYQSL